MSKNLVQISLGEVWEKFGRSLGEVWEKFGRSFDKFLCF